jgi:hypothetical protein
MAITPVLDDLCRRFGWRGVEATHSSTAPVLGFISEDGEALKENSPAFARAVLDYIEKRQVKNVVIAARWASYPADGQFETNLLATVRAARMSGARVYVVKDVPTQDSDMAAKIALAVLNNGDLEEIGITPERHQAVNHELAATFEQISLMGATVVDPASYFLNRKGLYGIAKNGQILYSDDNHLTLEGARLLAPLFEPIFQNTNEPAK